MRLVLVALVVVLAACHREAPVTFLPGQPLADVEVERRHHLSLDLSIGVGEERERQPLVDSASLRAQVERRAEGVVVRWLEDRGMHPSTVEGRSLVVNALAVRSVDDGTLAGPRESSSARALAQVGAGPDALQVALMQAPLRRGERRPGVDEAFGALAARTLGGGGAVDVEEASLRLEAATDSVAVFSAALVAKTHAGPVTMTWALRGTLEVRRSDTFPLSLALEGPVRVTSEQPDEGLPDVTGEGSFVVLHRARELQPARPVPLATVVR
ncbi:MAG: hypothetical protein JNJ54_30185 [Myxococcaceae bacterium]|nr:hypothetical protein [Myxococcaceae bacterium]